MKLELKIVRKKYFKILLSMTIIISLGVALLFGLINGVLSLHKSVDNFIVENNYPDIKIITEVEEIEKANKINQEEFKNIEYRLSLSTIININNEILSVKASTYDDKDLDDFYIYETKENDTKFYDIFVERGFANNNNIKVGDILKLKMDEKYCDFYVSKIISVPEALVSVPVSGIWGEINDYGNVYINRNVLYEETNKVKNELLDELSKKEEEVLNEESKRRQEYNDAKDKINSAIKEYNNQKNNSIKLKNNLNNKKSELNNNKVILKEIRKEYITITNTINKYENVIYSYIDEYSDLSDNLKDEIDRIIEEKYPNISREQLEFLTNIGYFIIQGKIDELIGQDREFIRDIVHQIMNDNLSLDKIEPYYDKIVEVINSSKDKIKNTIQSIYNSSNSATVKAKDITKELLIYVQDVFDKSIIRILSEFKNNVEGKPIPVIDKLLSEMDKGINTINNNIKTIDSKLSKAYKEINNNRIAIDEAYNTFEDELLKVKQEINDRKEEINSIKGYENKFNEILICLHNVRNKEAVLNYIKDKYLKNIVILNSYTYEHSPIYSYINNNIGVMENLAKIVPTVFYIVILIVLFLFISLMIKQSKREISILRLLGKTNNNIRMVFLVNNLLVAIFGIILGIITGFFPMIYVVEYYKNFFLLPKVIYEINLTSIIFSTIITIIVVESATIMATMELDRISPVEILKKEVFQNKEISKLTEAITNRFKPFTKFNILVYLRNKSKLILGIMCTSMTVAMFFSSLAYIASKNTIFNRYFEDRVHYDMQIFKNSEITNEDIEDLRNEDYVQNADLLRFFNVKVKYHNKEEDIVINALDNKNNYIKIFDKNNKEIKYPENGIVLEEHIANNLGLKINDFINIDGIDFKIVDISFQSFGRVNYISLNDSYKLKSSFDTVILRMDNSRSSELVNKVSKDSNYIYTVNYNELRDYNKKIFDSYTLPSIIIIIFTLIIGYVIIININIYNLLNQKKNLSVFRSLGFQYSEISKNWFKQSLIQWMISTIIGIPCGIVLSKFFLKSVSSSGRDFIYASGIKEYLITILLLFLYIYIGHRKTMRIFRKMDIVEEVKDRD